MTEAAVLTVLKQQLKNRLIDIFSHKDEARQSFLLIDELKAQNISVISVDNDGNITSFSSQSKTLQEKYAALEKPISYHNYLLYCNFDLQESNKDVIYSLVTEQESFKVSVKKGEQSKFIIINSTDEKPADNIPNISRHYDELTSVYSRYHFTEILESKIEKPESNTTLALIDINNFKIINDSAGFEVGDVILMELSSIIRGIAAEDDTVGRLSGDEFVILFNNKEVSYVESKIQELYTLINSYKLSHYETKLGVSVSIGIVDIGLNTLVKSAASALQFADYAAMTAKKNGFMFQTYTESNDDIIFFKEAPIWIERIRSAIEYNHFELFAQEIRPVNPNNEIRHAELLIRMKDGKGGHYPPAMFFEVAEKFNLMLEIDEWVVIEAFKWNGAHQDLSALSINLSAESINNTLFVDKIISYAKQFNVNPQSIIFEVTETVAIDDFNKVLKNVTNLKTFGFKISLDDFGSGYSTLTYLQNIDADFLKIDGVFIENIQNSAKDQSIVASVVKMAHSLNMKCIAEFVSCYEAEILLKELGVDYVQGFGVHKPELGKNWLNI